MTEADKAARITALRTAASDSRYAALCRRMAGGRKAEGAAQALERGADYYDGQADFLEANA